MEIKIPTKVPSPKRPTVPPAGRFPAKIRKVTEEYDHVILTWSFRAENRTWSLDQELMPADLGIMLAPQMSGQTIEVSSLVGLKATIYVRTRANRTSAIVSEVTF